MKNKYTLNKDNTATIYIKRRNGKRLSFVIDQQDLPIAQSYGAWHAMLSKGRAYICSNSPTSSHIFLSKLIKETPDKMFCSFIDRNPLNLRRSNLINVNKQDLHNNRISSLVHKKRDVWAVKSANGGPKWHGTYKTKAEATKVADRIHAERQEARIKLALLQEHRRDKWAKMFNGTERQLAKRFDKVKDLKITAEQMLSIQSQLKPSGVPVILCNSSALDDLIKGMEKLSEYEAATKKTIDKMPKRKK